MQQTALGKTTAPNKWLIFSLVAVGVFMSTLDGSIVNIALPAIMGDLVVPLSIIGWIPMIYLLTVSSLLLNFGRLSDIRGRRWVYSRGFFVFALGSLFCGMAHNALELIFARFFSGSRRSYDYGLHPCPRDRYLSRVRAGKGDGNGGRGGGCGADCRTAHGGLDPSLFFLAGHFFISTFPLAL